MGAAVGQKKKKNGAMCTVAFIDGSLRTYLSTWKTLSRGFVVFCCEK